MLVESTMTSTNVIFSSYKISMVQENLKEKPIENCSLFKVFPPLLFYSLPSMPSVVEFHGTQSCSGAPYVVRPARPRSYLNFEK